MKKPRVDKKRAKLVFERLLKALRANRYPYNVASLPQQQIPEDIRKDPLDHAVFLFYVCHLMRGAIQSDMAIRQLVVLRRHTPAFFQPELVSTWDRDRIKNTLVSAIDYHGDEVARFWQVNSKALWERWQGDPRLIFRSTGCADSLRLAITNKKIKGDKPQDLFDHNWGFEGFQGKMASMLAYFLMEAGLIGPFPIAPAVDFHLLRVMLSTEVLKLPKELRIKGVRYDQMYPLGVKVLEQYCKETGVSTVEIGDALWAHSTTACRAAPGNTSLDRTGERDENGKKKIPRQLRVRQDNPEHVSQYEQSCHRCPVQDLCNWNVPAGPYYEVGKFMLYDRVRLEPHWVLFEGLPDHPTPKRLSAGQLAPQLEDQLSLPLCTPDD